jgi:hypothetical protein
MKPKPLLPAAYYRALVAWFSLPPTKRTPQRLAQLRRREIMRELRNVPCGNPR